MAYFGLTEKQHESQVLFQHTFDLHFKTPFVQFNETTSWNAESDLNQDTIDRITELNHLDVELYQFAKTLMESRYKVIMNKNSQLIKLVILGDFVKNCILMRQLLGTQKVISIKTKLTELQN